MSNVTEQVNIPATAVDDARRRAVIEGAARYGGLTTSRPSGLRVPTQRTGSRREDKAMILLRRQFGDELRQQRLRQGRTLREVSAGARVSLGYLSEVERGQKEASSELLAAICAALDLPLSVLLRDVADRVAAVEPVEVGEVVAAVAAVPVVASAVPTSTVTNSVAA